MPPFGQPSFNQNPLKRRLSRGENDSEDEKPRKKVLDIPRIEDSINRLVASRPSNSGPRCTAEQQLHEQLDIHTASVQNKERKPKVTVEVKEIIEISDDSSDESDPKLDRKLPDSGGVDAKRGYMPVAASATEAATPVGSGNVDSGRNKNVPASQLMASMPSEAGTGVKVAGNQVGRKITGNASYNLSLLELLQRIPPAFLRSGPVAKRMIWLGALCYMDALRGVTTRFRRDGTYVCNLRIPDMQGILSEHVKGRCTFETAHKGGLFSANVSNACLLADTLAICFDEYSNTPVGPYAKGAKKAARKGVPETKQTSVPRSTATAQLPADIRQQYDHLHLITLMAENQLEELLRLEDRALASPVEDEGTENLEVEGSESVNMKKEELDDNENVTVKEEDDSGDDVNMQEAEAAISVSSSDEVVSSLAQARDATQASDGVTEALEGIKAQVARANQADWDNPDAAAVWGQVICEDLTAATAQLHAALASRRT